MSELLELHRASAGSGKTYTLAKKFLWYFLTILSDENDLESPRRLRTEAELHDSLKHILAVTFTNKATNEMKQRIVEKLDAIAYPKQSYREGNLDDEPDYMRDFIIALNDLDPQMSKEDYAKAWNSENLDVKWSDVSRLAWKGLYILLENYSDFQVSTIDSFFQSVLRTFAYETDLNDSYAIELDSDYLSKVSIDATLQDIEESQASEEVRYWIRLLMQSSREKGDNSWNLFQKRDSSSGVYSTFISWLKKLDNEDFKKIRSSLEDYFEVNPDLRDLYERMEKRTESVLKTEWDKMVSSAKALLKILNATDIENPSINKFKTHAKNSAGYKFNVKPTGYVAMEDSAFEGKTYLDRKKEAPELYSRLEEAYVKMREAYKAWTGAFESPEIKHWSIYRKNFPYLGLLHIVLRKRREYLEDNNSVELAETNTLLQKIIGKDDAPFVYERLGTRLNHYLIDEFQDTSDMQWQNFKPLLQESLGRGNENLLIGDAKQSIYRFRNADSSLISSKVDEQFGKYVKHFGDRPEENTNYRSSQTVVEFNNGFFSFLKERLGEAVTDNGGSIDFRNLYANVNQNFSGKKSKRNGYVEVNFIQAAKAADFRAAVIETLPEHINELRSRGFRLKDIALLVRANDEGESIINRLTAYNTETADASKKIEFISEQSLKVSSSVAVKLILNTLAAIAKGVNPEVRSGEEARKKGVVTWQEMESNFRVFSLKHPELSTPEKLQKFLESGTDTDAISSMLEDMKAVTLPALVESIVGTFLPEDIRLRDLAFISAFQDIVLEYCESRPSDISSFLLWWQRRGLSAAIASPDDMDAVKVMTIHKSKGLEFPCVIIPFATDTFNKASKTEWRWVKPFGFEGETMPDYMPVETTSALNNSEHESLYREYVDLQTMDTLNTLYVGFTRAVNELYIYCKDEAESKSKSKKGKDSKSLTIGALLREFMQCPGDEQQACIGNRYEEAPHESAAPQDGEGPESKTVEYKVRANLNFLKYRTDATSTVKTIDDDEEDEEEEDDDPRSEGNICHAILENIITFEDIPTAVNKLIHKGFLPRSDRDAIIAKFERWLAIPEVKEWFDGSCRVKTERSIIKKSNADTPWGRDVPAKDTVKKKPGILLRPDRILFRPDGSAVIVDYKFGDFTRRKKYARQIKNYIYNLKSTGRYPKVEGYLWYVKDGKLEKFG